MLDYDTHRFCHDKKDRLINILYLQGGLASGPGLTAYVLISLLENNDLEGVSHTCINPHLPSGLVNLYQLDESISNFKGVWCTFSFLFCFA